jgi:hypothetical protein
MPKKILLSLSFLLVSTLAFGDNDDFTKISSEADLVDSALYLVTLNDGKVYWNMEYQKHPNCNVDSILMFESFKTYPSLTELKEHTILFRILKRQGHWLLLNTENDKFVGEVDGSVINQQLYFNSFLHSNQPDSKFYLTIEKNGENNEIMIGKKCMRYNYTAHSFRLVSKSNTTFALVELYRIKNGTPASTLTLDENGGLGDVSYSGNVKFNRTFESGYYNTLVLPFAVDNPQTVFGSHTNTFEISASTDTTITFRKMSANETLKANTPYLINGTFTTPPYIINKVEIDHQKSDSIVKIDIGPVALHGVFRKQFVGGTQAFILYQKAFYCCTNLPTMTVKPFKWYLTVNNGSKNQIKALIIDGDVLNIDNIKGSAPNESTSIYNLQGMKLSDGKEPLPSGIYIKNHKKIIIR